jgi:hypothetical protein
LSSGVGFGRDSGSKRRKRVYFVMVFCLLRGGHPMVNYEFLKDLFSFKKIKNMFKKH